MFTFRISSAFFKIKRFVCLKAILINADAVMYRAQFAFDSCEAGVLLCSVGDQFTVLDSSNDQWWLVQNGHGQVGYVPASYLVADDVRIRILCILCMHDLFVCLFNPAFRGCQNPINGL